MKKQLPVLIHARPISILASVAVALFLAGCGGKEPPPAEKEKGGLDRTDATSTATAILTAYKSKDLKTLATLCNSTNRGMFDELANQGEAHPRYNSIWQGWRWEAVAGWDGTIRETRYDEDEALVHFADMEGDEIAVVVLSWEDDQWAFEDVNSPDRSSFKKISTTRQN